MLVHCAPSCFAQGAEEFQRGTAAYAQKNYAVALGHFRQSAQKGNVTATYYLAMCHLGLKQDAKAIELFQHISKNFPNTQEADMANTYLGRLGQSSADATPRVATGKSAAESAAEALIEKAEKLSEAQWKALPQTARIPFQMKNGHMYVQTKIKGRYVNIVFDTGASMCGISRTDFPDLFSAEEIEKGPVIPVSRPHGVQLMHLVNGEVSVDRITRNCTFMVTNEPGVSVIGQNFFKEYTYEIDGFYIRMTKAPYVSPLIAKAKAADAKLNELKAAVPGKTASVQPRSSSNSAVSSVKSSDKYTVPFEREKNCMIVEVMVNGKPTKATFDTGCAPDGLVMPMGFVSKLGIEHNSDGFYAERAEIGPIIRKYAKVHFANGLDCILIGPKFFGDRPYTVDPTNNVIKFQY
jgi:predicted aspartyl protease